MKKRAKRKKLFRYRAAIALAFILAVAAVLLAARTSALRSVGERART